MNLKDSALVLRLQLKKRLWQATSLWRFILRRVLSNEIQKKSPLREGGLCVPQNATKPSSKNVGSKNGGCDVISVIIREP